MKRITIFIYICLMTLVVASPAFAVDKVNLQKESVAELLPVGETLTYAIRWTGIPAGKTVITNKGLVELNGRMCYHIVSRTQSNSFVSTFYEVNDTIETWIDAETMASLKFKKKLWEGSSHRDIYVDYDYDKMTFTQYSAPIDGPYTIDSTGTLDAPVQDPLSALFFFRRFKNYQEGDQMTIDANADEKNWKLVVEVKEKDGIKLWGMRKFWSYKVSPLVQFEGIFIHKGEMNVWVDENWGIPLQMRVDVPIGAISVSLEKAENTNLFKR